MFARKAWYDEDKDRCFEFITNNFELPAEKIASIYKNRWQIELLFKRIKQNFPLKYFLGNSENAIKIQIWVTLIATLILQIVHKMSARKWAFSNVAFLIKYHLHSYIMLFEFLKNPQASYDKITTKKLDKPPEQLYVFESKKTKGGVDFIKTSYCNLFYILPNDLLYLIYFNQTLMLRIELTKILL